jgi:hypothetical protein
MLMMDHRHKARVAAAAVACLVLAGCANVTRMEAASPGTTVALRGVGKLNLPREEKLGSKATGQYEFMATSPSGQTMYGLLPLKVNGGTMAASIVFFAPALAIGGFRDVFPFYQVDPEAGVVRYKVRETDEWRQYKPLAAEMARARAYFQDLASKCGGEQKPAECADLAEKQ